MYVRQDTRKHFFGQQLLANFCLQGIDTFGRCVMNLNAMLVMGQLR